MFSALQANAPRFTGRSDLMILSRNIAGKLNLGITLTSYNKIALDDLGPDLMDHFPSNFLKSPSTMEKWSSRPLTWMLGMNSASRS
ncbi:Os03g0837850 [Oryza sativa Japonica Group]|uniref:Os03g0837850 protein n=1 Tax=Oryza sativa subsp. japonica TaxID=39947 RepID=A0A0N7KID0_ORYSJ|nr:hypothetical protein EE612_021545 [Oryza sativa]BAS87273.1 Os03g0837850 [Oryza sativa Japonica Group]